MIRLFISLIIFFLFFISCTNRKNKALKYTAVDWSKAELIWQDEFNENSLDTTKWKFQTGDHGWGNNEWQKYTAGDNAYVSDGTLKIICNKTGEGQKVGDYTSARINSRQSFTYGRMEIRAKMPDHKGNGLWPAIWMLGENISTAGWPECGEIDIMEYVSYDPGIVHFSIHSKANNHVQGTQITSGPMPLPGVESEFHNYGILWTENDLKFYLNDPVNVKLTFERPEKYNKTNWPFGKPFYFLFNMAVGGNWGGKQGVEDHIFPAVMEIDYIRVYQII